MQTVRYLQSHSFCVFRIFIELTRDVAGADPPFESSILKTRLIGLNMSKQSLPSPPEAPCLLYFLNPGYVLPQSYG